MYKNKKFLKNFEEQTIEMTVLIECFSGGGGVDGDFITTYAPFLAYINDKGELVNEKGSLTWQYRKDKEDSYGYNLKALTAYKVKARKCIPQTLKEYQSPIVNERYYLEEIISEDVFDERLKAIAEEYAKPVVIHDEICGDFTLDRRFDVFDGNFDWLGEECGVHLSIDRDCDTTADNALNKFRDIVNDLENFDKKVRKYVASQLTELANEWLEDEFDDEEEEEIIPITEESFAKRLVINDIDIRKSGITIYFADDDMFWGHSVLVEIDESGEFESAYIAG